MPRGTGCWGQRSAQHGWHSQGRRTRLHNDTSWLVYGRGSVRGEEEEEEEVVGKLAGREEKRGGLLPSRESEFLLSHSPIWLAVVKTIAWHLRSLCADGVPAMSQLWEQQVVEKVVGLWSPAQWIYKRTLQTPGFWCRANSLELLPRFHSFSFSAVLLICISFIAMFCFSL